MKLADLTTELVYDGLKDTYSATFPIGNNAKVEVQLPNGEWIEVQHGCIEYEQVAAMRANIRLNLQDKYERRLHLLLTRATNPRYRHYWRKWRRGVVLARRGPRKRHGARRGVK